MSSSLRPRLRRAQRFLAMLPLTVMTVLTGCSDMTGSQDDLGYTPETREISDARDAANGVSSEIYDIIGLSGKVSEPGPGVSRCGDKNADKFYVIRHPWALTDVPVKDMKQAMVRLKKGLPERGWKIVSYGPDTSPSKSLELLADSAQKKFSVNIHLYDETGNAEPDAAKSKIHVSLVSACFQVPEGKTVDEY